MKKFISLNDYYNINNPPKNSTVLEFDEDNKKLSINKINLASNSELSSNIDAKTTTIMAEINILNSKIEALKKSTTEVVIPTDPSQPINKSDETKDFIIEGDFQAKANIVGKSIVFKNNKIDIPSGAVSPSQNLGLKLDAVNDIQIKNNTINFDYNKASDLIFIQKAETLIIKDTTFTGKTYNTLMTGQGDKTIFLKNVLIDNCNFNQDSSKFNIWFAGWQDNAILTISNCHFKSAEQFLCIGDFHCPANPNNKLTINLINCTIDNYDDTNLPTYGYEYAGYILLDSRGYSTLDAFKAANPFTNITFNINNLTVKNQKITANNFKMGTKDKNQSLYLYIAKIGQCITYSKETKNLFPKINIV